MLWRRDFAATTTTAAADSQRCYSCAGLPSRAALQSELKTAVGAAGCGLDSNMWATVVANDGTVCAVAFSGAKYSDQWLASSVISAQKTNTANGPSHSKTGAPAANLFPKGLALSTANLYSAIQPGRQPVRSAV